MTSFSSELQTKKKTIFKKTLYFDIVKKLIDLPSTSLNDVQTQILISLTTTKQENLINQISKGINHVEISKTPLNRKSFFYSRFEKGSTLIDGKTVEKSNIIEEKTEQESKKKGQQSSEASK